MTPFTVSVPRKNGISSEWKAPRRRPQEPGITLEPSSRSAPHRKRYAKTAGWSGCAESRRATPSTLSAFHRSLPKRVAAW